MTVYLSDGSGLINLVDAQPVLCKGRWENRAVTVDGIPAHLYFLKGGTHGYLKIDRKWKKIRLSELGLLTEFTVWRKSLKAWLKQ